MIEDMSSSLSYGVIDNNCKSFTIYNLKTKEQRKKTELLQTEFPYKWDLNFEERQTFQHLLRLEINNRFKYNKMSDVFAVAVAYISDLEKVSCTEELLDHFETPKIETKRMLQEIRSGEFELSTLKVKCMCGQHVNYCNTIELKNKDTRKKVDIGNVCVIKEELTTVSHQNRFIEFKKEHYKLVSSVKKKIKKEKLNKKDKAEIFIGNLIRRFYAKKVSEHYWNEEASMLSLTYTSSRDIVVERKRIEELKKWEETYIKF